MKLDYSLIKVILQEIEENTDGLTPNQIDVSSYSPQEDKTRAYHFRILIQEGFIDGEIKDVGAKNEYAEWLQYKGLHLSGHKLLEAMESESIWQTIKGTAQSLGIEGLKQIPSLAINLLLQS
jgi:hypothetical protein